MESTTAVVEDVRTKLNKDESEKSDETNIGEK